MQNIILCGGIGTRLWPISRQTCPKQFADIFGDSKSLFQRTVERNFEYCDEFIVVSNKDHVFYVEDQLGSVVNNNKVKLIVEPVGRNTAPAIAFACLSIEPEEIVLVTPSDHVINNLNSYKSALAEAKIYAQENKLVTFGIKPDYPSRAYGYIEAKGHDVLSFHEKPSQILAIEYFESGSFYWNSGIFCFKAGVFLEELKKFRPDIYFKTKEVFGRSTSTAQVDISYDDMMSIPKESIDYAVMEKSEIVKVIPSDLSWNDIGSFDSLAAEFDMDENDNTLTDKLISVDSKNNFVYTKERAVALVDINDMIIVDTDDAILISGKNGSQKVRQIVDQLEGSKLTQCHKTVSKPWGKYTVISESEIYKSKRIEVKQGKRLSLQSHKFRDELWTIVGGKAKVTLDDKEINLNYNDHVFIKKCQKHRIENCGQELLVFIEIQTGTYFGEDDIVRYQDDYGRVNNGE